MKDTTIIFYRP